MKLKKIFDIPSRQNLVDKIISTTLQYPNGSTLCISSENDKMCPTLGSTSIQVHKKFGTPSLFGEAWIASIDKQIIALKKILLTDNTKDSFTKQQFLAGGSAWSELAVYILSTILVFSKVNPNLPITFRYYYCKECQFLNKNISKKKQQCIMTLNEMGDGDLKMYLKSKKMWNAKLIANFIFQVLSALYTLQKYFNMTHNDLHWGNVLVHEIQKGGYWKYTIDGIDYYIENLGYVFVLWDFGMVEIPGKMNTVSDTDNYDDLNNILSILYEEVDIKISILEDILDDESIPLHMLITKYFNTSTFTTKRDSNSIIDSFNMDVSKDVLKEATPIQLRHLFV